MEITISEAAAKIKKANSIIIAPHVNPDCDGLGSTLGLYHALTKKGHKVRIFVDDDIPEAYHFLPGWELFKKPDQKITGADLFIVLDAEPERTGRVNKITDAPILNFDHHRSNTRTADFLYLAPYRAATGEIIYELLAELGIEFDYKMAVSVYAAIATDCGFFRYSNTTEFTMKAAGDLLGYGVRPNIISEALEQRKYADVKAIADVINTIELYNEGKIAVAGADKDIVEKCSSTEGFVDLVRVIEGVDVAVLIKYAADNVTRISMRSKKTDVAAVAEKLGGGGHVRASGCNLEMSFHEARKKVIQALTREMAGQENAD
ncbi:DHH family phosphoesterase [Pectinatus haikarae]|uniref:Phosphoesterase RecJ-like protein n=1 Tax=Pectinatus haikarae TaxID=349096 RepID=A0ABT9Y6I5_9FIRM|nr:bifunctional oligoribonuclease/PAP phosphatase NrnA [Pectinatus haikarae]MDQ0203450.1 phosphoesterase RecJ-like protein [Pectinatus haikarae]